MFPCHDTETECHSLNRSLLRAENRNHFGEGNPKCLHAVCHKIFLKPACCKKLQRGILSAIRQDFLPVRYRCVSTDSWSQGKSVRHALPHRGTTAQVRATASNPREQRRAFLSVVFDAARPKVELPASPELDLHWPKNRGDPRVKSTRGSSWLVGTRPNAKTGASVLVPCSLQHGTRAQLRA